MMSSELNPNQWAPFVPQQWLGIAMLVMFLLYVVSQVVERFEAIAKYVPFGKWWHSRKNSDTSRVAKAITDARKEWEREDNEALNSLRERVDSVADVAAQQAAEIAELRREVHVFTMWSAYDSRWHHRHTVANTASDHVEEPHLDYFQFENLYAKDPTAAAKLLR